MELAGHNVAGLRLVVPGGLLHPVAGARAPLGHAYQSQLVGLSARIFTGWLEVDSDGHGPGQRSLLRRC